MFDVDGVDTISRKVGVHIPCTAPIIGIGIVVVIVVNLWVPGPRPLDPLHDRDICLCLGFIDPTFYPCKGKHVPQLELCESINFKIRSWLQKRILGNIFLTIRIRVGPGGTGVSLENCGEIVLQPGPSIGIGLVLIEMIEPVTEFHGLVRIGSFDFSSTSFIIVPQVIVGINAIVHGIINC